MPTHKSCFKRIRQSDKARLRNRALRSQLRTAVKDVRTATQKEDAAKKFQKAMTMLDKAATYGLIHKKTADRNKSRLAQFVNKLG